jgi:maltose O-acetyltransferase
MKNIYLALYYLIVSKLPSSHFPTGRVFTFLRGWILKKIIKLGKKTKVQRGVYIGNGSNIVIGNSCQINENIRFNNVIIGDNVMIAREVVFLGNAHNYDSRDIPMSLQGEIKTKQTIVEDDVWIGLRVIIMPGIRIKKGAIIGSGSVVTKDVEEYGIYAGVPSKLIRFRS